MAILYSHIQHPIFFSPQEEGKKVKRKSILLDKKLQQKLKKKFSCETGANAPIVNIPYINEVRNSKYSKECIFIIIKKSDFRNV